MHLHFIKETQRILSCHLLDLETLGPQLTVFKNLPNHLTPSLMCCHFYNQPFWIHTPCLVSSPIIAIIRYFPFFSC